MPNLLDAQTEVHVQLGNGAPAFIPTAIGQHYIDIANKRVYQSTGVNSVGDWGDALATLDDLAKSDFTVTKADVGLDKVENYGVASKAEAEGGEINDAYMTPLRVTELLNALYKPTLDAFMARTDNPHQVTAAQVGALTAAATEALLAEKLNSGDLAGLLQVFWSEKVGGAPETLDTIDEIAAALQNNPEVIEALQALVEGNRLTIVEAMDAIAALQSLVGESTAQAADSALLEGRSVADLTASDVEATSGVVTDKFMTPSTSKAAFDARWAEKVGTAPETLDTIEELAAALRNTPDALAALEAMAKEYTDTEVLAAIAQLSGVDMPDGTTLASVMLAITALQTGKLDSAAQAVDSAKLEGKTLAEIITQIMGDKGSEGLTLNSLEARLTVTEEAVETLGTSKLDATAQAVDSAKLGGKSLSEVIDSAIQPGRLFYPVVHVNGNVDQPDYVMPTPAEVWAQVKTNAVLEQVDTVYAIGVRRLHPGNLLALTGQEGISLVGAVSQAQEGPTYVVMRANVEASVWEVVNEPMLGCLARLSKHCVVVGENAERFVPGQTLFYNGFEALSEGVYYDWTVLADKEWEVVPTTDSELLIDSARYHRTEIRIQSVGPVVINVDVEADLPFEMELRVVNMTGVSVTFAGANITSSPRMEEYAMTKVNGVVRVVRHTNTAVSVAGDLDEAFFANPEHVKPE